MSPASASSNNLHSSSNCSPFNSKKYHKDVSSHLKTNFSFLQYSNIFYILHFNAIWNYWNLNHFSANMQQTQFGVPKTTGSFLHSVITRIICLCSYIVIFSVLSQFLYTNDVCCGTSSCITEYETVPLYSWITMLLSVNTATVLTTFTQVENRDSKLVHGM